MSDYKFAVANDHIGGDDGSLDKIDGNLLADGYAGIVVDHTNEKASLHTLDASSGESESSPQYIQPDSNPGTKMWKIVGFIAKSLECLSGVTITEFSNDGTMADNSDAAVPTEKAVVSYVPTVFPGFVQRTKFTYSDTDTITLAPAVYHHAGTLEQAVYWDSTLTFVFGSGGSNAGSDDLGASEWHYLYIDDSALSGAAITAARLLNDTTAPSWSDSKHGWYNGNDRCIGAFLTNGSSEILMFTHDLDFMSFGDPILDLDDQDIDNAVWADVTLSIPAFAQKTQATFTSTYSDGNSNLSWRTYQDGSSGHIVVRVTANAQISYNSAIVMADTSQKIEVKHNNSNANTSSVYTDGWFFPVGM